MQADLTMAWAIGAALSPVVALQRSAQQYSHVPVGAEFDGYK